jgi:hypothetical protein
MVELPAGNNEFVALQRATAIRKLIVAQMGRSDDQWFVVCSCCCDFFKSR